MRPVAEGDLALLTALTSEPDKAGEYEWFGWRDSGDIRRGWEKDRMLGADHGTLAVDAGGLIGCVGWHKRGTWGGSYCWNMGITLAPEARCHGYGTEAQRFLAGYLFAHTPVNRVEAETEAGNLAERRALEKAGFTREGVIRGCVFRDGRWRDGMIYSVLRGDIAAGLGDRDT